MGFHKPHAVCIPFPAQGHINPMFRLAILLHNRGFHITFTNTEYNHNRLLKSLGPTGLVGTSDFQFETIPDGLPPSDADTTQDVPSLFISTKYNCLAPFRQLLAKLNASSSSPPVTCIVSDAIMTFSVTAAHEIGVPVVCFRTTNACSFLCNKYVPLLIQKGLLPLKDANCLTNGFLDTSVDCIPGLKNIKLSHLPTFVRTTDVNDPLLNFVLGETEAASRASAMIFNTFDALEADALAALYPLCPPVYAIGPVHACVDRLPENSLKSMETNLWKQESDCLLWLDSRKPNSVVYVNFGSITTLTKQQVTEFARGLADSGKDFLWIIRSDSVVGGSSAISVLPSDFVVETKERGLISGWCPQEKVLSHCSVAAFITHCGWNSVIESLWSGVPMICWPFFADQHINCRFTCSEWGVGVEICRNVKRDEVEEIVREVVGGSKGKKMKNRAMEWKNKAEAAVGVHGSTFLNLEKLVKEFPLSCPVSGAAPFVV
ncbi:7-deoxyloganetin glucosyltransferase [Sesamum angolense]|uniref:Glycosyltransferase n=1 Tax=Sesamum angolense TaxID=2727404 RepID=A0AAE1X4C6_9LAMI|nr:7-deoxyloganetin glucosyltransferase [Sesamum angolense]